MDAVRVVTPFQSIPEYKETFKPLWALWDIPAKVTTVALTPLTYLASVFSARENCKKLPNCAEGHILWGSWPELCAMDRDLMRMVVSYSNKYGQEDGICKLNIALKTFYIVNSPDMAKEILNDAESYKRGDSLRVWRKFSEGGLSEGEDTQRYRIQAINFIGNRNLASFFPGKMKIAETWNQRLAAKETFDLFHEAERVTLAAMGETFFQPVFGENPFGLEYWKDYDSDNFLEAYSRLFQIMTNRFTSLISSIPYVGDSIYSMIYSQEDEEINDCKDTLKGILEPIFKKIFENPDSEQAQKVCRDFGLDPKNIDLDDLLDKSLGFLQASFETASKGLAWLLYLLGKDQAFQDRLREELLKRFGEKKATSYAELKEVPLLIKAIEEALRLYTPFPFLLRDIVKPENFTSHQVDKGGTFIISPLLVHHNPRAWENAEIFNPDRWTDEMLKDDWQIGNPSYQTFLGGAHRCPGRFFAKQEIAIFLSNLLLHNRVVLDNPNKVPELKLNITLHSKTPVPAHLERL